MAVNKYIIQLIVDTGDGTAKVRGVSKVFEDLDKQVNRTKSSIDKSKKSLDDLGGAAGIAGATAAEFGRLISDLPYGIQAVTNNVSQLGSMFALLVSSSNGVLPALRNLGKVLLGPAGILIAFQAVVAAIEFFSRSSRDAAKAINDMNVALQTQRRLIQSIALATNDELLKTIKVLTTYSTEFKELFEGLLDSQGANKTAINELVTDYGKLLGIRRQIEAKEKAIGALTEKQENTKIKLLGQINNLRLEETELMEKLSKYAKLEATDFLGDGAFEDIEEFSDSFVKKVLGIREKLEEPIFGGFFDLMNLEEDVLEDVRKLLEPMETARREAFDQLLDEGGIVAYYETELDRLSAFLNNKAEMDKLSFEEYKQLKLQEKNLSEFVTDAKIRNGELELQAIAQQREAELDILSTVFQTIGMFAGENRTLQAVALVGESAAGIAKIIINTKAANAALSLQAAIAPFLAPALQAQKVANNRSAAAGILSNLSATAKAVSALKAPVSLPSSISVGGDTSTSSAPVAPAFNIVGASGRSQLAELIAGQTGRPVKAYVVAGEVTSAQSLERNRIAEASI